MTTLYTPESIVKDIVNDLPKSSDIFKRHRIDFCCNGNRPVKDAALDSNANVATVLEEVHALYEKEKEHASNDKDWTKATSEEIVEHIINHYHRPLLEELDQLSPYVTKITKVHGDHHPELLRVNELFYSFKKEMIEHSAKEEEIVFPALLSLPEKSEEERVKTVAFLRELEKEHDAVGQILRDLREVAGEYEPPIDACGSYRLVYKRLEILEGETFLHIHTENNILFPRYGV